MNKFKIGDKVRVITRRKVDQYGKESVITTDEDLYDGEQSWALKDSPWRWKGSELELVQPSPVRTHTVTEIVDGVYGRLSVARQTSTEPRVLVGLANEVGVVSGTRHGWSMTELTDAIFTLTAIRDALEGGAT